MTTTGLASRRTLVGFLSRRRTLRAGLVQLLYVGGGIALGLVVPRLHTSATIPSFEAAALLAGATAGLLALTGIVFALLFMVIQFAATAQSPRLHLFRDNPLVWHALGLVIGVIVYATTCVVVTANDAETTVLVPISVVILVVLAVALTRRLQLAALRSVQLSSTLQEITARTRAAIDLLYTEPFPQPPHPFVTPPKSSTEIRWPHVQGYLQQIDLPDLLRAARDANATIRLCLRPGELVREQAVVMEISEPHTAVDAPALLKCLDVGIDRNFVQDPLLGFRLLNDIGLRAMSAAINDPASAVQVIDSIESLLTILVSRDLAVGLILDDSAAPRVIFDPYDWEDYLAAGVDEIAETPMLPMVDRRLRLMLELILAAAPTERRAGIEQRIARMWPPTVAATAS